MTDAARSKTDILGLVLLVLLVGAIGLVAWSLKARGGAGEMPIAVGTPLPEFEVEGWLNLAAGESFEPHGELVVVDCWATWCGPCLQDLPRMAELVAHYKKLGVRFVGVTQETAAELPAIEGTIRRTPGFTWPVAFGGGDFLNELSVRGFPTVILFGPDGKARWSGYGSYGLDDAIDAALDEPQANDKSAVALTATFRERS